MPDTERNLEDLTEEELLAELGLSDEPSDKATSQQLALSREIYQRHIRSKRALRTKIARPDVLESAIHSSPSDPGSRQLPKLPRYRRAEHVEDIMRPKKVCFFYRVKCTCEECEGSADRKWDMANGMQCLLSLPVPVPSRRPYRKGGFKPDKRPSAEVVIIVTSLRTSRSSFNDSTRSMHLLNCKRAEYYVVDVNSDVGPDVPDRALVARWRHLHWVFRDPSKTSKTKKDVVVPQILIDGVPVGGFSELQMLEEENDLDHILAGESCPNCLVDRSTDCGKPPKLNEDGTRVTPVDELPTPNDYCYGCGAVFRKLINNEVLPEPQLSQYIQQSHITANHASVATLSSVKDTIGRRLPRLMVDEDVSIPNALRNQRKEQSVISLL